MNNFFSDNRGQSLLEAIVAVGIFVAFFAGAVATNSNYLDSHDRSTEINKVKSIVKETFGAIESISYENWDNINDGTFGLTTSSGKWAFQSSPDKINGKYKRKIQISSITRENQAGCDVTESGGDFEDPETKFVTTTISWDTGKNTSTRVFGRYLSKWYDATNFQVRDKNGIVFTQNEELKTLDSNSSTITDWDPGNITVIGPMDADFDDDGLHDIVYLKNKNKINIVDDNDNRDVNIANQKAKDEDSVLGVENWNESGTTTFYVSDDVQGSDNEIYRSKPGSSPTVVAKPNNGAIAMSGAGDIDGDDTRELVFVDQSQNLRYIEPADSTEQTFSLAYGDVGQEDNVGVGSPGDFDGDNTSTVPVVNSNNDIVLVDDGGEVETILDSSTSGEDPSESPIAVIDIDGDCLLEVVFVDNNEEMKFIDEVTEDNTIKDLLDSDDNRISVDENIGIRNADTN